MESCPTPKEALITEEMRSNCYCYAKEEQTYNSCPLSFQQLEKDQKTDKQLMTILSIGKSTYQNHSFHGGITRQLICQNSKIVVPTLLQMHVISWYHMVLCHPGMNKIEEAISQHLWWPAMREQIMAYVQACPTCQKNKWEHKKYGHIPPKEAEAQIWDKMCIDLIGPYKICRKGQPDLECK